MLRVFFKLDFRGLKCYKMTDYAILHTQWESTVMEISPFKFISLVVFKPFKNAVKIKIVIFKF